MRIAEIHSGHLTARCARQVWHQERGEYEGSMSTALYRGAFAGKICEEMHNRDLWDIDGVTKAAVIAVKRIRAEIKKEGRELTDAVKENKDKIHAEVVTAAHQYAQRFGERFRQCELIGCEIPVRWTSAGRNYASHIDLLLRDPDNVWKQGKGRLLLADWKWWAETPTIDFLARFKQLWL